MKVFVILESLNYTDGGNSASWGVYPSMEKAIADLPYKIITKRYGYTNAEQFKEEEGYDFYSLFSSDAHDKWVYDIGDWLDEFYIQEDDFEE